MSRHNSPLHTLRIVLLASLALALLVSCGGAEAPPQEAVTRVITDTVVVEGEQVEVTRLVTEGEGQTIVATGPAPAVTPAATGIPPQATAEALEEIAEVEWPGSMRMGESDVVRLSLLPRAGGYEVRAEFAEHRTVTETVTLEPLAGYDVVAAARLDGVGFNLAPRGEQLQDWRPDRPLTWRWTISPLRSGQQRLSLSLTMQWRPEPGRSLPSRQLTAFSRALDVQVAPDGADAGWMSMLGIAALALALVLAGPLLLRRRRGGATVQQLAPDAALRLEPGPDLTLGAQEQALLQAVFRGYGRAVVEHEFRSGYSGARTFLVLPIRLDGRADAYTIAKVGARQEILREYENYETYVEHTLPPVTARIQGRPVTANGRGRSRARQNGAAPLAALRYTFIGAPGRQPRSLRQALMEEGGAALLETLFRTFGPNWWMQRRPYAFRLATEYDCKLPVHAVVVPGADGGVPLHAQSSPAGVRLIPDQSVTLHGFEVSEQGAGGQAFNLTGTAVAGQAPLRLRWLGPAPPDGAPARVADTRETLLQRWTANLPRYGLPDPLPLLPAMLAKTVSGSRSIIHGDLNVENALVGPGEIVWLIDFARTREGHTLFDFAHLGAELAAHVLPGRYASSGAYAEALAAGEDALLNKVQEIAARCLVDAQQPDEYRLALAVSCLGALKHENLDEKARSFLYLTAAHLAEVGGWQAQRAA